MIWSGTRHAPGRVAAFALVVLSALLACGAASGQTGNGLGIVVIDTQQVYREAIAMKGLQQQLDLQRSTYLDQLRNEEKAIREADQELAKQRGALAADVFADKRRKLEERMVTAQRDLQERKRELDRRFSRGMARLQSVLVQIAQEIAQGRKADLVIEKSAVVLVRPELEITREVLSELNRRLPEIGPVSEEN